MLQTPGFFKAGRPPQVKRPVQAGAFQMHDEASLVLCFQTPDAFVNASDRAAPAADVAFMRQIVPAVIGKRPQRAAGEWEWEWEWEFIFQSRPGTQGFFFRVVAAR